MGTSIRLTSLRRIIAWVYASCRQLSVTHVDHSSLTRSPSYPKMLWKTFTYVRLIFRTLLATIYKNFCSGPPLEKILGAPLPRSFHCVCAKYVSYLSKERLKQCNCRPIDNILILWYGSRRRAYPVKCSNVKKDVLEFYFINGLTLVHAAPMTREETEVAISIVGLPIVFHL